MYKSFLHSCLNDRVDADTDYEQQQILFYGKSYPSVYELELLQQNMFVIAVPFNEGLKHMLSHCKKPMEYKNGQVDIDPNKIESKQPRSSYCSAWIVNVP